ncbi:DUF222 domain-containing protein [Nocardia aurantia]|uniref:DUF222 domain-containing protein n=1 Tax=Nocardia aurantia TaxID=2585199 RepID=A0A7K0E101_9NOCA|nr:DUF222 domain-containing protein [Nocardia aurantia]MQY31753.1 hypothetical protein [Nocardia aurantia]
MFDSGELQAMSDEVLVDALRRAHGAAAFAQAAEVRAVRELYRRRRAEGRHGGVAAGEFAAAEAMAAVQVGESVAAALIDVGVGLDQMPRTSAAFESGLIDLARAQVIVEAVRDLPVEVLGEVEQTLVETAARSTPGRLRQTARRWVTKIDPGGEQRRREQRELDRDVRISALQDGVALFDGVLPAMGAQVVANRLREMGARVCSEDPRNAAQRRADALVALAQGEAMLTCACGRAECPAAAEPAVGSRVLVQVGVSFEALAGLSEDPGLLAGYGPVDAALVRRIAEQARLQVIPEQAEAGEARVAMDGQCRFPGCTVAAAECVPETPDSEGGSPPRRTGRGPGGRGAAGQAGAQRDSAVAGGTGALCAHHHRLRLSASGWRVRRLDGDRVGWTSPTGDRHTTVREGARYLFPHSDSEAPDIRIATAAMVSITTQPGLDLTYPISTHRQSAASTPEDAATEGPVAW